MDRASAARLGRDGPPDVAWLGSPLQCGRNCWAVQSVSAGAQAEAERRADGGIESSRPGQSQCGGGQNRKVGGSSICAGRWRSDPGPQRRRAVQDDVGEAAARASCHGQAGDENRPALPRTRCHPSNAVSSSRAGRIAARAQRQAARSPHMTDHGGGNDKGLTGFGWPARSSKTRSASHAASRASGRGSQFPTLSRWLRFYRRHGMASLQPRSRSARRERREVWVYRLPADPRTVTLLLCRPCHLYIARTPLCPPNTDDTVSAI